MANMTSSAEDMNASPTSASEVVDNLSLSSYVPFGVVTLKSTRLYPDNDNWTETDIYDGNLPPLPGDRAATGRFGCRKLMQARWVRVFHGRHRRDPSKTCLRIYVLPEDVARRDVPRNNHALRTLLSSLLRQPIDHSSAAWNGYEPDEFQTTHITSTSCPSTSLTSLSVPTASSAVANDSLFYIFNTMASPTPDPNSIDDDWASNAAADILEGLEMTYGVRTQLYPYQRRSVAAMMQREMAPKHSYDPRLENFPGPTGQMFFFDHVATQIFRDASYYEQVRGGILAETMGYGKTLIVLALMAASKDQMPKAPVEHAETRPFTNKTGARSLMSIAAHCAVQNGVPWRQYFSDLANDGLHWATCVKMLQTPPYYEMIDDGWYASRQQRSVRKILLVKTTLVIVPSNLFYQWQAEISNHLEAGALNILMVNVDSPALATAEELAQYDFILIDKKKFQLEHGTENDPLRKMHFLRLVIDEGHAFAATGGTNEFLRQVKSLRVERRWIMSGTPTSGTVGVEVDLAASADPVDGNAMDETALQAQTLERRKQQRAEDNTDLHRLGRIVTELLQAQPWCNSTSSGDAAGWTRYTAISDVGDRRFFSAATVRAILESIVIRHRIGDVEAELPALHNTPVFISPTTYDKATMDLFTFTLAINALTSERVDQDYLFHTANRKYLDEVVSNLRRAPFFWSGFKPTELSKSLHIAEEYAEKHGGQLSNEDALVLAQAVRIVPKILEDKVFQALADAQEIGLCVAGLPQAVSAPLGIDEHSVQLVNGFTDLSFEPEQHSITTASRLLATQKFCNDAGSVYDPLRELVKVVDEIANTSEHSDQVLSAASKDEAPRINGSPKRPRGVPRFGEPQLNDKQFAKHATLGRVSVQKSKKRTLSEINKASQDPALLATDIHISGTVSAKLSYLLSRVLELNKTEKILIFYEGDHIAWYIAQSLEAINVAHFIYANKMPQKLRNKYLETFAKDDCAERVMLIDIKQGSHGLNITAASRIFFVNPVWHVGTEAQAIKRAHRIGQSKPVYVETLILQHSIEHRIFERRRRMTRAEQAHAKPNPLDDNEVHEMLKKFEFYDGYDHIADQERYAPISPMPQLFPELAASQARDESSRFAAAESGEAASTPRNAPKKRGTSAEARAANGMGKGKGIGMTSPAIGDRYDEHASDDNTIGSEATAAAVAMIGVTPAASVNGDATHEECDVHFGGSGPSRPAKKVKKSVGFSA